MRWIEKLMAGLALACFLPFTEVTSADPDITKYIKTDSAYVYSWNSTESVWVPSSVQLYAYKDGKVTRILTLNYATRSEQFKTEYAYNAASLADTVTNYSFNNGWTALTRNVIFYDLQQRVSEIWIQKRINGAWSPDRKQMSYVYDDNNRQLEFQSIYWRNNAWTLPSFDYSYYDEQGKLIRREAFNPNGSVDYQVICNYDRTNLLSEMYSQYPTGTGWQNWWLVNYQYDGCGFKISQVQYAGSGTEWIPGTKTVIYSSFRPELYPEKKIPVCHKGHTIIVSNNALNAHLAHGDCPGECLNEKGRNDRRLNTDEAVNKTFPFVIYPNPATEKVNIRLTDTECPVFRIELLDFNGRMIRSFNPGNQAEFTLDLTGLKSGNYVLRVTSDMIYSTVISRN
jgi:hypothetical protein